MELYLEEFLKADTQSKAGDCARAFQAAFEAARTAGEPCTLFLPKNSELHIYKDYCPVREYHTSNTDSTEFPKKTFGLLLEDLKDFTLEGQDAQLIFHGDMCAVGVVRSENIALKNFSWDFASPTTSQITVKSHTATTVTFEAAKGCTFAVENNRVKWTCGTSPYTGQPYYVQYNNHKSWSTVGYDPKSGIQRRRLFSEFPFQRIRRIEPVSSKSFKIRYFGFTPRVWQKDGMVAQLCASKKRPTAGAFFWESQNISVIGVTAHYMHGFGWLTQMCKDVTFSGCRFVPDDEGRYCTSYADLIHVSGAGGKILIENCEFSHAHDDPINIHGTFTRLEKRLDEHTAVLSYVHKQQGGFPQFHVGDEVVFYKRDTLGPLNDKEEIYTVTYAGAPGEDGNNLKSMTVRFDKVLPKALTDTVGGEPRYVAENVTYTPEVTIRDCVFRHIPTRGILCTTRKKVVIERNFFDNIAMACIFISNDSNDWYESGPVRDMTICNNEFYIRESGQKEWKDTPAVYVHPVVKGGKLPKTPVHQNITIEKNVIHLFHDKAFVIESVDGLTIRHNTIIKENPIKKSVYSIHGCTRVDSDLE